MNLVHIILDDKRQKTILNAVIYALENIDFPDPDSRKVYLDLISKIETSNDILRIISGTGEPETLKFSMEYYAKKEFCTPDVENLIFHINRLIKQAEMCKKSFYLTCVLNLQNQIHTSLDYD